MSATEQPVGTVFPAVDRLEWLKERRRGVGSSDAPAVCRLSPYKTPLHIYLDKTGQLPLESHDTPQLKRGRVLEPLIVQMYCEEYGRDASPPRPILWHASIPHLFCSIDRFTFVDGAARILEVKTASTRQGWGEPGSDVVPLDYHVQVQEQMLVSGLDAADIAVLFPDLDLRVYTVRRNEELIRRLIAILGDFWARVLERRPPPLDWQHPKTPDLVEMLSRLEEGVRIDLDPITEQIARKYLALGQERASLDKQRESLKAILVHYMGEADTASAPGVRVTRKRKKKAGFYVEPTEYVELRVHKEKEQADGE